MKDMKSSITQMIESCEKEPIHIPGSIQPFGYLIAFKADSLEVTYCSSNIDVLCGRSLSDIVGFSVQDLFPDSAFNEIITSQNRAEKNIHRVWIQEKQYYLTIHTTDTFHILEIEPADTTEDLPLLSIEEINDFIHRIQAEPTMLQLCQVVTGYIRQKLEFDRVMIYRFFEDNSGEVLAESLTDGLEPYLGLRYPEGDIPKQARDLYLRNLVRIIPDVSSIPVSLFGSTKKTDDIDQLDLSDAVLRSVSPIHIQYLKNMGVGASFSVSIIQNKKLWGLISCHHLTPKNLSPYQRQACLLYSRLLSSQLEVHMQAGSLALIKKTDFHLDYLLKQLSRNDLSYRYFIQSIDLMHLTGSTGVIAFLDGILYQTEQTPPLEIVERLGEYLHQNIGNETFISESVIRFFPEIEPFLSQLAGILYCPLDKHRKDYIMWIKPEQVQSIPWAGQPPQTDPLTGHKSMTPRSSFAAWIEQVKGQSEKWHPYQISAARRLAPTLQRNLYQLYMDREKDKQDELVLLNQQLRNTTEELEAFSYTVAHDLRTPLRAINAYTRILLAETESVLSPQSGQILKDITRNATQMGVLIDSLLEFARIGQKEIIRGHINMQQLVHTILSKLKENTLFDMETIRIDSLENTSGDPVLMGQVWFNLLSNAIKYTQYMPHRRIEIGCKKDEKQIIYSVKDNGAGFDMKYYDKLFGVFNRLHDITLFEGTGIGLAIVKKIIERHSGKVWATAVPNLGATFFFSLPNI